MIFSNCVSFPGVAMLKLGGSSSRRQRNSAWQSCCHIMTGTAKKTVFDIVMAACTA